MVDTIQDKLKFKLWLDENIERLRKYHKNHYLENKDKPNNKIFSDEAIKRRRAYSKQYYKDIKNKDRCRVYIVNKNTKKYKADMRRIDKFNKKRDKENEKKIKMNERIKKKRDKDNKFFGEIKLLDEEINKLKLSIKNNSLPGINYKLEVKK